MANYLQVAFLFASVVLFCALLVEAQNKTTSRAPTGVQNKTTARPSSTKSPVTVPAWKARCKPSDVLTQGNGAHRRNWYPLSGIDKTKPLKVKFNVTLKPGEQFYASPLLYCGVLVMVGMENNIYLLDPKTGALINKRKFELPYNIARDRVGGKYCGNVVPYVGMLATPVIDPQTNTLYVVYKTYAPGTTNGSVNARYMMNAVDVFTLVPRKGFPVILQGSKHGSVFNASFQMCRPGLLLQEGKVFAACASHCDYEPYQGWVVKVDAKTGRIDDWFVTIANNSEASGAGIWMAGAGLSSDRSGRLYATTGDSDPPELVHLGQPTPGKQPPKIFSNAAFALNTKTMQASDFFVPYRQLYLDENGLDFGQTSVHILPKEFTTAKYPNLGVAASKESILYLLNLDDLGGFQQGPNKTDAVVQKVVISKGKGFLYPPAITSVGRLVALISSSNGLNVLKHSLDTTGKPRLDIVGVSNVTFPRETACMVTTNGTKPGSAVVWVLHYIRSMLFAFDVVPDVNGSLPLIAQFNIGKPPKFLTPVAADGMVYMGTLEGRVIAIGN